MSNRRALPWHRTPYQGVPANARLQEKAGPPLSPAPPRRPVCPTPPTTTTTKGRPLWYTMSGTSRRLGAWEPGSLGAWEPGLLVARVLERPDVEAVGRLDG